MNFEKLKNELELDEKLNVVAFESGVGDLLLYDNIMIINYAGNGYRIIFDDTHVLVQMLMIADITNNSISFDEACDYVGNDHILISDTIAEVIKSQIEYCEWKFGKFTNYDY